MARERTEEDQALGETSQVEPDAWPPAEYREVAHLPLTPEIVAGFWKKRNARHPKALEAILADARMFARFRGEPIGKSKLELLRSALRLAWQTEAFLSLAIYRIRADLKRRNVPVLPQLLHHISTNLSHVCIGDPVVIEPGIYMPHGHVVIDGIVDIARGVVFAPWVGIGLEIGQYVGPQVSRGAYLGTGSRVLGPVRIGAFSRIAANSVVVRDVPKRATVAGIPARVVAVKNVSKKAQNRES